MQNNFSKCREWVPRGTSQHKWRWLTTLLLILTLGIGQMWGAGTALADLNFSGITAAPSAYTYSTTNPPSYQASQGPSGDKRSCMLIGNGGKGQTPTIESTGPKTGEGKRWMAFCPAEDCNLEIVCTGSGKEFKLYDKNHYNAKTNVDATTSHVSKYTAGSKWSTWEIEGLQAGKWYVLSVTGSSSYVASMTFTATSSPVCPSGLSISGTKNYTEGQKIELTAALTAGNGSITYQWYKGGTAEANKLTGKTDAKLEIASCTGSDAGDYYCVASKTSCSDAVNAEAYTVTVATIEPTGTATISYALSGSTTTGTVTGVNSISGLSSSLTLSTLTLSGTKDGYSGAIKGCTSTTELVEADYVDVQFTVGSGYVFTPSAVTVQVNPFTATGAVKAVVKVMDAQPLVVASEVLSCAKSTDNEVTFASGAFTNKKFEGTVHLRMYFYGPASDKAFYLKSPISITGTVAVAPTKYNVTFDKNDEGAGGSQTTLKYEAGAEVTLPACTFDAPTGKEFDAWTSTDVTITDGKFTMPSNAVTIKATWKTSSTKYTVTYKEGETTLDTEDVVAGTAPTGYSALESKNLASFVAWYNNADLAEEHKIADMSAETVSEATTYYGKWTYNYASSVNIEQWTLTNGAGKGATTKTSALIAQLGTNKFASNLSWVNGDLELDSLSTKSGRNEPYLGLKVKVGGKMLDFRLAKDSYVKVKFGEIKSTLPQVSINGGEYENMVITEKVWSYTATGNDYISIKTADANAVVFKQIMINEDIAAVTLPWRVTYNANGGTCATAEAIWSGSALTLPDVTPAEPTDYTFAGWYDEATGGVLVGAAGASYTPTDNTTLHAQFAPVEYAIAYDGNGATSGSMTAGAAGWGTLVTPDANAFVKSGNVFSGWVITKTSDGSATGITFSEGKFEMPKYDVTLVAQWEDNSKVAVIVETNVKYESLSDAVAAATDGQTIQLLQNNNVTAQVEVAGKAITLDLAGYKIEYTGTSTLPSGVILVHNGASLTIDDSSDPDAGSIVSGADAYAAIALTKAGDDATNPAVLVINGGIFTGYYYAITGNGSRHNTEITINAGTFTGTAANDNSAIYHPQQGTLIINGGTFTGYSAAIELRAGTLEINDGTFTATATEYSCNPSGSGTTTVGAAIAIAQHNTQKDIAVTINGGTFEGVKAINEANPQGNPAPAVAMSVTGGDFTGEVSTVDVHEFISGGTYDAPVTNENCAYGYVPAPEVAPGVYTVMPKDGVSLVKIVPTSQTKGTQTGLYPDGDELTINLSSGMNLGGSGKYIGVKATENFQEGDVLHLNMSAYQNNQNTTAYVYADKDASVFLFDTEEKCDENKDYYITMPAAVNGHNELYIVRTEGNKWNGGPSVMEVTRAMKPMLTAITIDGRDGVIDEANKTVAVQVPYEANLAALTVVPTIVWNEAAATNSIVVNDGSAWVEGPNSYKLTDKDGDYTVYTITLTRDVLKHAVKFYDGETLLETVEVEDATSIAAGDVPADPTKEDYIFQGWAETAGGDVVDVTSFTISAAKNFYAKWASDGAIKLINKTTGAVNEDGYFITGVTATEANSEKAAAWGGTQGTSISGVNALGKIVQYNANTNQTKIKIKVYNTNNSDKYVYIHKIIEGKTTEESVETLTATSKTVVESEFYEFNDTKNRSFYLTTNSTDVKILQVKVIDDGATPMKQAGEAGYELNLNKGRVLAYANTDINFEGLEFAASSNYGVISSTELQIKAPLAFTISSPVTLTLNNNSNKYQVSQSISGSGDEYAAGEQVLDLTTTGTWYIVPTTTSAVKLTSIAFALPKCEAPVFGTMEDIELCATEAIPAIDGTATVSDGGDVTYKWYAEGDAETVLATTATYTPAADGSFYVVATNSLAGHQDVSATSVVVKVSHFASVAITTAPEDVYKHAGLDAELSVVAEGKNVTYEWFTCDDELGTNPVAIVPAETGASLNLTAIEAGIKYYQVVVTDECGTTASAVAKVEGFNDIALVDVTGNMFWDFSKASDGTTATSGMCNEAVLVNVPGIVNNSDFESDNIMATANKFASGKLQASMIKFHTTVPGIVKVVFSNTGSKDTERYLVVNGVKTASGSKNTTAVTYYGFVPAGDVELTVVDGDGNMLNFTSVKFIAKAAPDYVRDDSWMAPGELGTFCIPQGAVAVGAEMYEFMGRNPENGKIAFDNVEHMEPGKPYLFRSNSYQIDFYYTDEAEASEPDNSSAMKGTFVNLELTELENVYYFAGHALWSCVDLTSLSVPANRAYVKMDEVQALQNPNPAPGRRRITLGVNGQNTATGLENLVGGEQAQKLLIDGQMYILRGEKLYDATGRLVK